MPHPQAELWFVDPSAVRAAEDDRRLDDEERARAARLRRPRDRRVFVAAHVLVREALTSAAQGVRPEDWVFRRTANGRPEIASPLTHLRFSLSHVPGAVACVVTETLDCGVDVEWLDRPLDSHVLARAAFPPAQCRELSSLPPEAHRGEVLVRWTRTEAVLKATGHGLTVSPRDVLVEPDRVTIAGVHSEGWQLTEQRIGRHVVTAAVRSPEQVHWRRREFAQTQPFCGSTT